MKKINKPLKKSELLNIIAAGWSQRREAAKIRSAKNSQRTAAWKLREKNKTEELENVKRQKHYIVAKEIVGSKTGLHKVT